MCHVCIVNFCWYTYNNLVGILGSVYVYCVYDGVDLYILVNQQQQQQTIAIEKPSQKWKYVKGNVAAVAEAAAAIKRQLHIFISYRIQISFE